ncbi:MAG: hydratase, partial [Sneathiella sp.]
MQKSEALADVLATARRENRQIQNLPDDLVPATPKDSYIVNQLVAQKLGWKQLGWKIAGTTEFIRKRLNLNSPIYGRTFTRHRHKSPATIELAGLLDPLIECEFFVTLAKELPVRDNSWTMPEIMDAIKTVHVGIEIAECRFPAGHLPLFTAVQADGCASGQYVFGDEVHNWKSGLSSFEVRLQIDGKDRRVGKGSDVMKDPIAPLLWLAEERR